MEEVAARRIDLRLHDAYLGRAYSQRENLPVASWLPQPLAQAIQGSHLVHDGHALAVALLSRDSLDVYFTGVRNRFAQMPEARELKMLQRHPDYAEYRSQCWQLAGVPLEEKEFYAEKLAGIKARFKHIIKSEAPVLRALTIARNQTLKQFKPELTDALHAMCEEESTDLSRPGGLLRYYVNAMHGSVTHSQTGAVRPAVFSITFR